MEDNEGFTQVAIGSDTVNAFAPGQQAQRHGLFVEFFMHPKLNTSKSDAEGRPMYDETEYVRIMVPGDKASVVERPARIGHQPAHDNNKYGDEYAAFKRGADEGVVGTPLEQWPPISRSQVLELQFFNIKTVEQLAQVPDVHIQKFSGVSRLRDLARRFMEHADGARPLVQMQAQITERDKTIEAMEQQMQAMAQDMAALKSQAGLGTAPAETAIPAAPAAAPFKQATEAPVEDPEDPDELYADAPMDLDIDEPDDTELEEEPEQEPEVKPKKAKVKKKAKRRAITT